MKSWIFTVNIIRGFAIARVLLQCHRSLLLRDIQCTYLRNVRQSRNINDNPVTQTILAIMVSPKTLNYLTFKSFDLESVPDDGNCRNASCTLN